MIFLICCAFTKPGRPIIFRAACRQGGKEIRYIGGYLKVTERSQESGMPCVYKRNCLRLSVIMRGQRVGHPVHVDLLDVRDIIFSSVR